jgi:hypothetical protein
MRVALFLFIIAGFEQWIHACQERKFRYFSEFNLARRGWCLGDETFRQELLAQMREPIGEEHYGEERAQTVEATAEQIIAAELKRRRWKEAALRTRPKGDPAKVALAARPRAETTMTVGWDRRTPGDGQSGLPESLALSPEEIRPEVANIKNRPLNILQP